MVLELKLDTLILKAGKETKIQFTQIDDSHKAVVYKIYYMKL